MCTVEGLGTLYCSAGSCRAAHILQKPNLPSHGITAGSFIARPTCSFHSSWWFISSVNANSNLACLLMASTMPLSFLLNSDHMFNAVILFCIQLSWRDTEFYVEIADWQNKSLVMLRISVNQICIMFRRYFRSRPMIFFNFYFAFWMPFPQFKTERDYTDCIPKASLEIK